VLARTSAAAAAPGPARQIGTATANEVARAHEVSIQVAADIAAGLCRVGSPALNTSMMRMAEPHHGQGLRGVGGSAAMSSGSGAGGATSSSLRASPRLSAFTQGFDQWIVSSREHLDTCVAQGRENAVEALPRLGVELGPSRGFHND
jgi:hypothetical protein